MALDHIGRGDTLSGIAKKFRADLRITASTERARSAEWRAGFGVASGVGVFLAIVAIFVAAMD